MSKHLLTAVSVMIFFVGHLMAQSFTSTVSGRVLDPQNASISGAAVSMKNVDTGLTRAMTAGHEGEYTFEAVPPGLYDVVGNASGFATTTVRVQVFVATPVRVDIHLGLKAVAENVTVIGGSGVAVQTESAEVGKNIGESLLQNLPSATRNPYDFVATSPGVASSTDGRGVGFAVNGQRPSSGNYLLDGGENNDTFIAAPGQAVPLDAVQEYRLQTNNFSAEYGRNSGFIANVVTKSGTNHYHGSLYEFNRNSAFTANTYDNDAKGLPAPQLNRNQFGGAVGGPIFANKLLFFGSLEAIRVRSGVTNTFFVPTPQLLAVSSPATQSLFQAYPLPQTLSSTQVLQRTVCPYGVDCSSGSGLVTIPAFALGTRLGPQDAGAGAPQNTYLGVARVDWNLSDKTQMFVRYAVQDKDEFAPVIQPYSASLDQPDQARNQNAEINATHLFSTTWLTESRFVYNRIFGDPEAGEGVQPAVPNPIIPNFLIDSEASVTLPAGVSGFGGPQNLYQFFQTASHTAGRHNLKFGGQYIHIRDNRFFGASQSANAEFTDTQGFVNGILRRYTIAVNPEGQLPGATINPPYGPPDFIRHFHYNEVALFLQDTWKVTDRLTVTPGLRWEYFGVLHSVGSERPLDANFYLGSGSNYLEQISNGAFLQAMNAPGDLKGHLYKPNYHDVGPRLGFAYDVFGKGKTVVRSGAGIFYDRNFGNVLFNVMQNPPNYSTTRLTNIPLLPSVLTNEYSVFPNAPVTLRGSSARMLAPNLKEAYTASWNLTIEQAVTSKAIFGLSYIGSSGNRLYTLNNINRIGSSGLLDASCTAPAVDTAGNVIGVDYTGCPNLSSAASTVQERGNLGHSTYNGLTARLDSGNISRLGLQFGASYTWSHAIDNVSSFFEDDPTQLGYGLLDAYNTKLDKGDANFDIRNRFVTYFNWQLPKFGTNRYSDYLLGGWQLSGLLTFQSGQPITLYDSGVIDSSGETTRPRLTGPVPQPVPLVADAVIPNNFLYIPVNAVRDPNTGLCLANAAPFACEVSVNGPFIGIIGRNTFRRPGTQDHNLSLMKNIPLHWEGMSLQLRLEGYNVFNHPNLWVNAGSNDVNAATFNVNATTTITGITARKGGNGSPYANVRTLDNRQVVLGAKLYF